LALAASGPPTHLLPPLRVKRPRSPDALLAIQLGSQLLGRTNNYGQTLSDAVPRLSAPARPSFFVVAPAGGRGTVPDLSLSACSLRAQLSLYSAPLGYAGLATGASSGIQMMAKSRAIPWKESPAHLEGMIGNVGFDPWGLSTPQNIKWMREAELKHGRMCQMAWLVSSAQQQCSGSSSSSSSSRRSRRSR
jgi:hypothetical protein